MGLLSSLLIAGVAGTLQSERLDEKAKKTYARAYDRQFSAKVAVDKKRESVENSIMKFANRKKAILSTSMASFLDLYSVIKKINFIESDGIRELDNKLQLSEKTESLRLITSVCAKKVNMTDEEMLKSFIIGGAVGYMFVKDSAQSLKNAQAQIKVSRVIEEQSKTIEVVFDGIIDRSERLSELLSKLNLFFVKSIKVCKDIVKRNGTDKSKYSYQDRQYLMNCMNFAVAVKNIIDVPLLDKDGKITEQSLQALCEGEDYLLKIASFK